MSVPARGLARHLVLAGTVTAGLLGGGAAALAAPAPTAGQTIPASCGQTVTASPGDEVRVTSRTGSPYVIPVTEQSPASQTWRAGLLCEVVVKAVARPVVAAAPVAAAPVAPVAPAAGTAPRSGALAPTAPVAPVAPAPAAAPRGSLGTAAASAPSSGLLAPSSLGAPAGAVAPGAALGVLPPVASGPAVSPGTDPATAVSRTAEGRPDTGDGPSDVPLVLGAIGVGAAAAAALRYRILHRRMSAAQPVAPGPAPEPVPRPAPVGPEIGRHAADDATQLVEPPMYTDDYGHHDAGDADDAVTAIVERVPAVAVGEPQRA